MRQILYTRVNILKSHSPERGSGSLTTSNLPVYEKSIIYTSKYNLKNISEQFMQFGNNQLQRLYPTLKTMHMTKFILMQFNVDNVGLHNEMITFLKKYNCTERPTKRSHKKIK